MLIPDRSQQSTRLERQLDAAQRISQALFQQHSVDQIIEKALGIALEVSDAEAGSILIKEAQANQLVFQYSIGHSVKTGTAVPWEASIAGAIFRSGVPELIPNVKQDPRHFVGIDALDGFETRDMIAVPLKQWEGRTIGVLEILNKRSGLLDEDDLLILSVIASFTALAIEQSRLLKEAKLAEIARLVGEISHDVNNMLTPVMLCAPEMEQTLNEMISRHPDTNDTVAKECSGFFQVMRKSLRRIQDRAKLIADCVKGEIAPPRFEDCRIEAIVKGVMEALQVVARQQGITLRADGLAELPVIRADEMRLYNAFYNLINNAIPEVPAGGSITVTGKTESGTNCVHLEFLDNGRGMPPEVRDSLFSSQAISRKRGGTGLGTKIVKDVVDVHGGTITVESTENVGTTFHLRFPLCQPGLHAQDAISRAEHRTE